jgi:hypothetical protein
MFQLGFLSQGCSVVHPRRRAPSPTRRIIMARMWGRKRQPNGAGLPKRVISAAQIELWLEEPSKTP